MSKNSGAGQATKAGREARKAAAQAAAAAKREASAKPARRDPKKPE